jgi:hypothetical protein
LITLSDYLNYLNHEFLEARKRADQAAIETAKMYAEDEYLQHFKAPRFVMPVIKLQVPIKIDAVDQQSIYDFHLDKKAFYADVNKRFRRIAKKFRAEDVGFSEADFENRAFLRFIQMLEEREQNLVREIDHILSEEEVAELFDAMYSREHPNNNLRQPRAFHLAMRTAFYETFKEQFKLVSTNINGLHVSPEAGGLVEGTNEKLLVQLDIEMVEEGLVIRKVTDANGNEIEEISVD